MRAKDTTTVISAAMMAKSSTSRTRGTVARAPRLATARTWTTSLTLCPKAAASETQQLSFPTNATEIADARSKSATLTSATHAEEPQSTATSSGNASTSATFSTRSPSSRKDRKSSARRERMETRNASEPAQMPNEHRERTSGPATDLTQLGLRPSSASERNRKRNS